VFTVYKLLALIILFAEKKNKDIEKEKPVNKGFLCMFSGQIGSGAVCFRAEYAAGLYDRQRAAAAPRIGGRHPGSRRRHFPWLWARPAAAGGLFFIGL
jgi:hypothetical protein